MLSINKCSAIEKNWSDTLFYSPTINEKAIKCISFFFLFCISMRQWTHKSFALIFLISLLCHGTVPLEHQHWKKKIHFKKVLWLFLFLFQTLDLSHVWCFGNFIFTINHAFQLANHVYTLCYSGTDTWGVQNEKDKRLSCLFTDFIQPVSDSWWSHTNKIMLSKKKKETSDNFAHSYHNK